MNDQMLRRIAEEIARQTLIDNWPFYLLLLLLSFLGATFNPFLKARFAKRGEVSATKADAQEILRQLQETTRTAKSVELSLTRGDWIQREKNVLIRTKLEEFVRSAYALAAWSRTHAETFTDINSLQHPSALDDFNMLANLYFPELQPQARAVLITYSEFIQIFNDMRLKLIVIEADITAARIENDAAALGQLNSKRIEILQQSSAPLVHQAIEMAKAAVQLGETAQKVVAQLMNSPLHS